MKYHYWDSVVWLGILNKESDKLMTCLTLWQKAIEGDVKIVSSALTLTEVIYLNGHQLITDESPHLSQQEVEEKITAFFEHDCIDLYSVERRIAEKARKLIWESCDLEFKVKPKDAIHVATAAVANVDVLNTYDPDLLQLNDTVACDNGDFLTIAHPHVAQEAILTPHAQSEDAIGKKSN